MKKKECIVHIGMQKTGSSSIQQTLQQRLESETFYYLDLTIPNHSIPLRSLFGTDEIFHLHKILNRTQNDIDKYNMDTKDKLIKNIQTCDKPIMIISGESITSLSKNELEGFRDFLDFYFDKITIVGYVRTPKSYIESLFQQRVKGGHNKFNIENFYPYYRNEFEKFDLVFGSKNVKLFKFDPKSFPNGNVVMDFCNRLGINMKVEETIRANDSLSKEALSLIYIYRKYGPGYGVGKNVIQINNKIINRIQNIGKTKIKFSTALINPILEQNREDILWMEKRLDAKLTENIHTGEDDIVKEEDLLLVNEDTVNELRDIIGIDYLPKVKKTNNIEEVVDLIHILRMKITDTIDIDTAKYNGIKLIELAQKIKLGVDVKNIIKNDETKGINASVPFHYVEIISTLRRMNASEEIINSIIYIAKKIANTAGNGYHFLPLAERIELARPGLDGIKNLGLILQDKECFTVSEENLKKEKLSPLKQVFEDLEKYIDKNMTHTNDNYLLSQQIFEDDGNINSNIESISMKSFQEMLKSKPISEIEDILKSILSKQPDDILTNNLYASCAGRQKKYYESYKYWSHSYKLDENKEWTTIGFIDSIISIVLNVDDASYKLSLDERFKKDLVVVLRYFKEAIKEDKPEFINVRDGNCDTKSFGTINNNFTEIIPSDYSNEIYVYRNIDPYKTMIKKQKIFPIGFYTLADCTLADWGYYLFNKEILINEDLITGHQKRAMITGKHKKLPKSISLQEKYLDCSGIIFTTYSNGYGHWILDILPKLFVLKNNAANIFKESKVILHDDTPNWIVEFIEEVFGKGPEDLIFFNRKIEKITVKKAYLPTIMHDSYHFHPFINSFIDYLYRVYNVEANSDKSYEKIYVSRKKVKAKVMPERVLVNEDEIEEYLSSKGFKVVHNEDMSWEQKIRTYSQAKVIVGPFGSGLLNAMFAPLGSTVVSFRTFNASQASVAAFREQRLFDVLPEVEKFITKKLVHYTIPIAEIEKILEYINLNKGYQ